MQVKIEKKANNQRNIRIDFFEGDLCNGLTVACYSLEPYAPEHEVNVEDFKAFVTSQGFLEWCFDFNDCSQSDGHGQLTGTLSWDEYCVQSEKILCKDLSLFLIHKSK